MKRRAANFVSPLLVGVCVCNFGALRLRGRLWPRSLRASRTSSKVSRWGCRRVPLPYPQLGSLGRIELHNQVGGGRVITRASLGEEQQIGDRFGAAIALADLDGDYCFDVVVGAPGVDGGGAVYVIYGTRAGLGTGASMRIPLPARPGDAFGKAVAVEPPIEQPTLRRPGRILDRRAGTRRVRPGQRRSGRLHRGRRPGGEHAAAVYPKQVPGCPIRRSRGTGSASILLHFGGTGLAAAGCWWASRARTSASGRTPVW